MICFQSSDVMSPSTSSGLAKPTFPSAASITDSPNAHATITGAPQLKKPESASGLSSKLMHPDEDISLVSCTTTESRCCVYVCLLNENI